MKKSLFLTLTMCALAFGAQAQRLVIGEKAPEVKVSEWIGGRAPASGAVLVDFFVSSNPQCVANLDKLNELSATYDNRLNVMTISREGADKMTSVASGKNYRFYMGEDDGGKTFTAFGVRFVPFAALIDARGRLVWTGNVSGLTGSIIDGALR